MSMISPAPCKTDLNGPNERLDSVCFCASQAYDLASGGCAVAAEVSALMH